MIGVTLRTMIFFEETVFVVFRLESRVCQSKYSKKELVFEARVDVKWITFKIH